MTLEGPRTHSPVSLMGWLTGRQPIRGVGDVYLNTPRGSNGRRVSLFGLNGVLDPITMHPVLFLAGIAVGVWAAGKLGSK